jgi:hypothetical protein
VDLTVDSCYHFVVRSNCDLSTEYYGEGCNASFQSMAAKLLLKAHYAGPSSQLSAIRQSPTTEMHRPINMFDLIEENYNFDSAFVASTKLFLPPKPNRYAATLRIWISSLPSVIL